MAAQIIILGFGAQNQIVTLGFFSQQAPAPDDNVDTHDGDDKRPFHELGNPYKEIKKAETVRQSLEKVLMPVANEPEQYVEVITALPKEGAVGVLGGDTRNMEIAMLMQLAALRDEDESISLLLMH